jgi:hypothetical protein
LGYEKLKKDNEQLARQTEILQKQIDEKERANEDTRRLFEEFKSKRTQEIA